MSADAPDPAFAALGALWSADVDDQPVPAVAPEHAAALRCLFAAAALADLDDAPLSRAERGARRFGRRAELTGRQRRRNAAQLRRTARSRGDDPTA
jgi:hypothetical protein